MQSINLLGMFERRPCARSILGAYVLAHTSVAIAHRMFLESVNHQMLLRHAHHVPVLLVSSALILAISG
jgi:hypothetical protein